MLSSIALLTCALALPTSASILTVPAHSPFSGSVDNTAIASDSDIIAELDFLQFPAQKYPSGIELQCPNCPFAVDNGDNGDEEFSFSSTKVPNTIDIELDTANNTVNLNGKPLLGGSMNDLHNSHTANQSAYFLDEAPDDAYKGALPITYAVRVVQVRNVKLEDGSLVVFYSVDLEVLSLGGRQIDVQKVNIHVVKRSDGQLDVLPFTEPYPRNPPLPAVSVPDLPSRSGTSEVGPESTVDTSSARPSIVSGAGPSATATGARVPTNGTSAGMPTVVTPTSPPASSFTGGAGSNGISLSLFAGFVGVFAVYFAWR